jgi:tetratricopeptide (TPR) repeat protein
MTIIDMHPDDLLDRELSGTLSPSEQRRLAEHLAQCPGCRLERQLRDDFSHELVASRAPDVLQTFVSGALRAALPADGATPLAMHTTALPAAVVQTPALQGRRASRRRAAFLAVAFVIASGAAAAQAGLVQQFAGFAREQLGKIAGGPREQVAPAPVRASARSNDAVASKPPASVPLEQQPLVRTETEPPEADTAALESGSEPALDERELTPARAREGKPARAAKSSKARTSERTRRTKRVAAPPVALDSDGERSEASAALDLPATESIEPAPRSTVRARARSKAARERSEARLEAPEAILAAPSDEPAPIRGDSPRVDDRAPAIITASTLFHRANSARREGLSSEALSNYERLRAEFPTSAEARLALVLAARMHLDSGRLGDAVAGFDSYIATRDRSLREQALAGRALALGRLGRTREELAAWQNLLRDYPDSSYATVASQRLRQDQR